MGFLGLRRRKPSLFAPVSLPTSAKFEPNDELEAERRRAAFWKAVEGTRRQPLDYDRSPPPV